MGLVHFDNERCFANMGNGVNSLWDWFTIQTRRNPGCQLCAMCQFPMGLVHSQLHQKTLQRLSTSSMSVNSLWDWFTKVKGVNFEEMTYHFDTVSIPYGIGSLCVYARGV